MSARWSSAGWSTQRQHGSCSRESSQRSTAIRRSSLIVTSNKPFSAWGEIFGARFPARKTIEEFDFAFQTSLRRDSVLHLVNRAVAERRDALQLVEFCVEASVALGV